mgnify:CR=1 FL=1
MEKIIKILLLVLLISGCTNRDIEFKDFDYVGIYFPHQTPLRTLILGDEVIGENSIDLEKAFSIGVTMGGAYNNTKDRIVSIEYAPHLVNNLTDGDGKQLTLMPSDYYNASFDKITIPAGSFFGNVRVNLTDAFFQDELTTGLNYVIPLLITEVNNGDTILSGRPQSSVTYPDRRIKSDWLVQPKDYVLFGVKYINPMHGVYLIRGKRTNLVNPQDVHSYSTPYLVNNDMTKLTTRSLTENIMTTIGGSTGDAKYNMVLTFDESTQKIKISQNNTSTVEVEGTGKYFTKNDEGAESYNGKKHRTIYLDYIYSNNGNTYQVNDSLVFVDTDITFESFEIKVSAPN